jgi:hypothetical protein
MAAPPSYNSDSKVSEDSNISDKASSLKLFILGLMSYAYGVDRDAVVKAYAISPADVPTFESCHNKQKRDTYFALSEAVARTQVRVHRNQCSLIPQSDYDIIYNELILPCIELELDLSYAIGWLKRYHEHQCDPSKRSKSYAYRTRYFNLFILSGWKQRKLARDLTAADVFVERFAPDERYRLVLGAAIADFGNLRCRHMKRTPVPVSRDLFAYPRPVAMLKVVAEKARKGKNDDFEKKHSEKIQRLSIWGWYGWSNEAMAAFSSWPRSTENVLP